MTDWERVWLISPISKNALPSYVDMSHAVKLAYFLPNSSGIYPGMAQKIMAADLQYPGCMQPRAHPELVPWFD